MECLERVFTVAVAPLLGFATFGYIRAKTRKAKAEAKKVELEIAEKLAKESAKNQKNKRGR